MATSDPPSSWDHVQLTSWLKEQSCLSLIGIETLESLLMLALDGQALLKVTELDLQESEELGFSGDEIRAVMVLRSKLEQIELRMCTSSPEPGVAPPSASGPPTYINAAGDWIVPAVCVDASGESYFAEKRVHVGAPAGGNGIGALSELFPASCVLLRATPGDYDFDFHVAPRRQFIVSLDAGVDIETSSGERRAFPAGTVMFVEDTWGRGHRSRAVGGAARHCVFIGVPDDVLV